MSLKSTVEDYALEIAGRCKAGEIRCKGLVEADFASNAPKNLAQALLNIFNYLAKVSDEVAKRIDWTSSDAVIERDVTVLRVLDSQVKEFAAHIRYVESARTDRLPWQVIPSFEKLVEALRPRAQVMLRPMWRYNYATIVTNLRDLYLSELQVYEFYLPEIDVESTIVNPLGEAFHIISFPALEKNNILLHSVIGHELGHLIASELVEKSKKAFLTDVRQRIEQVTDDELTRNGITPQKVPLLFQPYRADLLTENSKICLQYWERAMEEILADAVGAVLFGPAALFSTFDVAVQAGFDLEPTFRNNYYPPWRTRIREVLRVVESVAPSLLNVSAGLFRMPAPTLLTTRIPELSLSSERRAELVNDRVETIRHTAAAKTDDAAIANKPLAQIAYSALRQYIDQGVADVRSLLGRRAFDEKAVGDTLPALIERLDAGITPNAEHDVLSREVPKVGLVDVLSSAWYHKASLSVTAATADDRELFERVRSQRNRLTLKAVEFAHLAEEHPVKPARKPPGERGSSTPGVLTSDDIRDFMERSAIIDRLIITPLFDPVASVSDAAIDVRLGTEFILFRKEAFNALDLSLTESFLSNVGRYQERVVRRIREPFVLHPRQLVIGSTLEYVQLPPTLMAYVVGKSTWGRTGLVIATATKIDPGFRGCITLEILNEGEVPLVLFPGIPIAQLVLHRTERPTEYSGVYLCPIGPEFPRFDSITRDAAFWLPSRRKR